MMWNVGGYAFGMNGAANGCDDVWDWMVEGCWS